MSQKKMHRLRKALPYKIVPKYIPSPALDKDKNQITKTIIIGKQAVQYNAVEPILNPEFDSKLHQTYKVAKAQ